jgi:hypothetical protein
LDTLSLAMSSPSANEHDKAAVMDENERFADASVSLASSSTAPVKPGPVPAPRRSLLDFKTSQRFHDMCLRAFDTVDVDGSGTIDVAELYCAVLLVRSQESLSALLSPRFRRV